MLTKLVAKNFKSLREVSVDLRQRNALVGPNMSGKSNLLDVLRFLRDMLSPEPSVAGIMHAFNLRSGFSEVAWKGSDARTIDIELHGNVQPTQHTDTFPEE